MSSMSKHGPASQAEVESEKRPQASVIMRCKNSDWVIEQALTALFSQEETDFELIVVDSGSQDRTLEIVRRFPCRLIEIEPTAYVPGAVLNMAAEQARGDVLVFQNSDTVPLTSSALGNLLAPLRALDGAAGRVVGSFARQVPRPEAVSWVRRDYATAFPATGEAPPWLTLSLPFAALRKSAWREHPFYTDAWASEDTEWGHWAKTAGYRLQYVPEAMVMHSHNYTLNQIYGRRFVEGEADAFIYRDRPQLSMALARAARGIAKDCCWAMRQGDLPGCLAAPARRLVYQWAHWRGHRWGWRRLQDGDPNLARGLEVILKNHDAASPRSAKAPPVRTAEAVEA